MAAELTADSNTLLSTAAEAVIMWNEFKSLHTNRRCCQLFRVIRPLLRLKLSEAMLVIDLFFFLLLFFTVDILTHFDSVEETQV